MVCVVMSILERRMDWLDQQIRGGFGSARGWNRRFLRVKVDGFNDPASVVRELRNGKNQWTFHPNITNTIQVCFRLRRPVD